MKTTGISVCPLSYIYLYKIQIGTTIIICD